MESYEYSSGTLPKGIEVWAKSREREKDPWAGAYKTTHLKSFPCHKSLRHLLCFFWLFDFWFFFCSCCCLFLGEARARALRRFIPHPARGPHGPRLFFYLSLISNGIWHQAGSSSWICRFLLLSLSLSLYLSLFFLASSSKLLKAFASSCCWITPLVSWLRSPTLNQSPKAETLIMGISILRGTKHIYTFLPFFFFVVCCCCWLDSFCSFSDEKHQDTLCVVWQNEI